MINLWQQLDTHLMKKNPLKVDRLPTFYPSAASCLSEIDGKNIGSCIRENYYRCSGYEQSDKDSVWSQYVFAGGRIWEEWVISRVKEMGIFLANNLKFVDLERYISGELDLVISDPEGGAKPAIFEMKTFYGYDAHKQILGTSYVPPSPKESNLLQAFLYLGEFIGQVEKVYLMYFARDDHARNQFVIEMVEKDGKHYPQITTYWAKANNEEKSHTYIDYRISLEGIFGRYNDLMNCLKDGKIPKGDFRHSYTEKEIETLFASGDISKTAYAQWQKDKDPFALGHWKCRKYCSYRTTCLAQKKEDGHL
jgi:hypothetical protein